MTGTRASAPPAGAGGQEDAGAIRALWDAMARGWAEGDAARFAASFAEDCDFTTVRGEKPPGRPGIEAGHADLFRGPYAGTVLATDVRSIRFLGPGLAAVDAESTVGRPGGAVLARTHALAIVARTAGHRWLIHTFHNMIPAARTPQQTPRPQEPTVTDPSPRPKLRHLALVAREPEKLAAFYCSVFAMELFHRDPDGSCFLSDGYLTLALVRHRLDGETPVGMNHFGFHVGNTAEVSAALVAAGVPEPAERATGRPFAEYRAIDPEGNWFDLSAHGFGGPSA
ncbi:SgcJ/EcaC family oxidoreductase [Streptomyces sp. CC210A]|uniref:SgcJ/EcaC family oxidoreductase n=1 Tax=Streptomyces sp. CC210A TaxID=2898184 RepID=UPI001F22B56F|nr:SgcJ/EcaC family oxidoreductase [Streptomyces sp. CC210A]